LMALTKAPSCVTTIVLMRHAQTAHNSEGRFQGRIDVPLDKTGINQAKSVAAALEAGAFGRKFDVICTSPLARASLTADIVASALGKKVEVIPELMEIDCGEVSGLTIAEAKRKYPEVMDRFTQGWWATPYPGGQSHKEYEQMNVLSSIRKIIGLWPGQTVLVISHGGFIRTAVLNFLGLGEARPFLRQRLDNCGLTTLEVTANCKEETLIGKVTEFNAELVGIESSVMDVYSKEVAIR
jgi:broad specificity phosphatase PhoE